MTSLQSVTSMDAIVEIVSRHIPELPAPTSTDHPIGARSIKFHIPVRDEHCLAHALKRIGDALRVCNFVAYDRVDRPIPGIESAVVTGDDGQCVRVSRVYRIQYDDVVLFIDVWVS